MNEGRDGGGGEVVCHVGARCRVATWGRSSVVHEASSWVVERMLRGGGVGGGSAAAFWTGSRKGLVFFACWTGRIQTNA